MCRMVATGEKSTRSTRDNLEGSVVANFKPFTCNYRNASIRISGDLAVEFSDLRKFSLWASSLLKSDSVTYSSPVDSLWFFHASSQISGPKLFKD
jgi:hypothetical protein